MSSITPGGDSSAVMPKSGTSSSGFDMESFISESNAGIASKGDAIQAAMKDIYNEKGEVDPAKLVKVQFEIGQYNTVLESISAVTKSITESMKSIAQRAS